MKKWILMIACCCVCTIMLSVPQTTDAWDQRCTVTSERNLAAVSEASWDKLRSVATWKDYVGGASLMMMGLVVELPKGTTLHLVGSYHGALRLRSSTGRLYYVHPSSVSCR